MASRERSRHTKIGWTVLLLALGSVVEAADADLARRGEYILRAAGCVACHTDAENEGAFLAGGRAFETPFGTFYSPNITADSEHGIGRWTEADFVRALSKGVAPDGSDYYPVFPYTSYTRMRGRDMRALWAYLTTVEPVDKPNRPHQLPWYMQWRLVNWGWKMLNFKPGPFRARPQRGTALSRGGYLAEALGHCGECHTPRNSLGASVEEMRYAGTREGPDGESVPNITPDRGTGIGRWSADDLDYFLETGGTPDGDYTGSLMAEVIDESLSYLTAMDREALVIYLRALEPIEQHIGQAEKKARREKEEFE